MYIEEFITPAMACSGVSIGSVVRKGAVLLCESDDVDIERIVIEFDDEEIAQDFERAMKTMLRGSSLTRIHPSMPLPRI
jgi:hypothetical protein